MDTFCLPHAPDDESGRLHTLRGYDLLNAAPEPGLDELTRFACAIFDVPEAQINLVDAERQYTLASARAVADRNVRRSDAFCPHAILQDEPFIVPDTWKDERFRTSPLVLGAPHIRFYAGFPLYVKNGYKLGSFCLVSPQPRAAFSAEEQVLLKRLARQASNYIENRALREREFHAGLGLGSTPKALRSSSKEHTGLLLFSGTLEPVYANTWGALWLQEARAAEAIARAADQRNSIPSVLSEAMRQREALSTQAVLGDRAFSVEVLPVGSRLAVFLQESRHGHQAALTSRNQHGEQERLNLLMGGTPLFWTFNPEDPSETDLQDWLQYTGLTFAEFREGHYFSCVHPEDVDRTAELLSRAASAGTAFEFDLRVRRFDGVYRWLRAQGRPRLKLDGSLKSWVGVHTDVTETHALQAALHESNERFELATLATTEGVWDLKYATGEMYYSAHLRELLGLDSSASSLQDWLDLVYPEDLDRLQKQWQTMEASQSTRYECEFRCVLAEGGWRWLRVRAVCLRNSEGRPVRLTGTAGDISAQRLKDPLTGLHNRTSLLDQLLWRIRKANEFPRNFALYFLDLDSFKQINDSLGHASGDAVILEVAQRLHATLANTSGNVVARLGGDEFVVLVTDMESEADAWSFGSLLKELLSAPVQLAQPIRVSASIGIAFGTEGKYTTAEEMLEEADVAMYNAKSRGKGSVNMFTRSMRNAAIARLSLEQDLRRALEEQQFELRYQPQVDMRSGRILGLEALLRWRHPERGWVSPADFIALAEETRLIVPIGEWVLQEVLYQIQSWRRSDLLPEGFTVAVNISAHQILRRHFSENLLSLCKDLDVDPRFLCLEVTEGASIESEDLATITTELQGAVDAGFALHLDDFGTGFSSLRYLQHFPFGSVKIDRSFVAKMCSDTTSRSLVQAIVGLAKSLNKGVIAEGVENEEQVAALLAMGCTKAQGFLYSAAIEAAEVESRWLDEPLLSMAPVAPLAVYAA